jgi:hypothetical protein
MMKYFCFGLAFSFTTFLVACGSSNNTTAGLAYTGNGGVSTGCTISSANSGCVNTSGVLNVGVNAINGGTETVTPLLYSNVTQVDASKTFPSALPVVAGDRVVILMSGSLQTTTGIFLTSSNLSSITASVSGGAGGNVTLGTTDQSLLAEYVVSVAGNLKISVDWPLSSSNSGTRNIYAYDGSSYTPGNIYVLHCLTTSGAAMACPQY